MSPKNAIKLLAKGNTGSEILTLLSYVVEQMKNEQNNSDLELPEVS